MGGKNKKFLRTLRRVVEPLVVASEMLYGPGNGSRKRDWVIESLNEKFDFPLLSEKQEAAVIGLIIDIIVDILNESGKLPQITARSVSED